jgi:L-ascorbate metabolism protein UlaG (beta-lactamase superfamily)
MKVKKIGHCCLIIEENGKRVMTDPGSFTIEGQTKENNIDFILITHEHGDHIHVDSLKIVLNNNPQAKVITNTGVGKLLAEAGIEYEILEGTNSKNFSGLTIEAHDCKHEEIFKELGQVQNTGYFIGPRLFYPGDSLYNPPKPVEILALPVAGPWTRVRDFMNYVLEVKPKVCFPVHDGMLANPAASYWALNLLLPKENIKFAPLAEQKEEEL